MADMPYRHYPKRFGTPRLGSIEARNRKDRTMMKFAHTLKTWRSVRDTENQLRRLSERELEDIGFARGDIPAVARGGRPA
jgi:uncharacterized protein YjiS (DUF1127 family)